MDVTRAKNAEYNKAKPAVVLVSGGLDSAVTLACAMKDGYACHVLTFRYGQRHDREIACACEVARSMNIADHHVIELDARLFRGSSLTGGLPVPLDRPAADISDEIPSTYVPARNTVFLAMALAYAEQIGAGDIFIGANAIDYSGYPDCRPEYIAAFERMANLATKAAVEGHHPVKIHAPLLELSKVEIIRRGLELGVDFALTWSCYNPTESGKPCGRCDSCQIRRQAFRELGMADPLTGQ